MSTFTDLMDNAYQAFPGFKGKNPGQGKSALMQALEGGEIWKGLGLGGHDFAKWNIKDLESGNWQNQVPIVKHYGRQWEDFKKLYSGSELVDKRLGLEGQALSWDKFNENWGGGNWENRIGSNLMGDVETVSSGIDAELGEYTTDDNTVSSNTDDPLAEGTIEDALTDPPGTGDSAPPSAMNSRAYGWASNIRRSLGDMGEDLYKTRGKRASILTRRGMLG